MDPANQTTDAAQAWDALVESRLRQISTPTLNRGRVQLQIRREPTRSARPAIRRDMAEVVPDLRATFRGLVSGELVWPLYLWGPAGTGKTSAALAMLDHCGRVLAQAERKPDLEDWAAGFVEVRALPRVRIAADQRQLTYYEDGSLFTVPWVELLNGLARAPLFVFDEIGVGAEATDFRLDTLLEVLDRRSGDPVRPFVVTSNLSPSEVSRAYDDRVASRILAGTVFRLDGADRRMRPPR